MKKILAVLIALFINNAFAYYGSQVVNGVTWYYNRISDGKGGYSASVTYKSSGSGAYSGKLTIPTQLGGYPVTSIDSAAFRNCTSLTSITIPDTVMSIGDQAFDYCKRLSSVVISSGVTTIGAKVFLNCESLSSFVIPAGVTSIGPSAFGNCKSLASIAIPSSVMSIGESAFYGCSSLNSVYIEDVAKWCAIEFAGHPFYSGSGGQLYLNNEKLVHVVIPDGVTAIGKWSFYGCKSIESIVIPDSVTSIGSSAFGGCSSLNSVYIEDIAKWCAFNFANDSANPCCPGGGQLYLNGEKLVNVVIPDGVTSIGNYTFYKCSSIESITIPIGVQTIGEWAFRDCSSLVSVTIPEGVTSIGRCAFYGCNSLGAITIPNSMKTIDEFAFKYCGSLESIVIPNGVQVIGREAFADCGLLASITLPDNLTSIGSGVFSRCNAIQEVVGWQPGIAVATAKRIVVSSSVTAIGEKDFRQYRSLSSIVLPNSVTSIGDYAFQQCSSLEAIVIPDGVMSIGNYVFDGCSSLNSITISGGVMSIGNYAFQHCSSLESIEIPDGVMSIGCFAFYDCGSLKSIKIPGSVTSVGQFAFYNCTSLDAVHIDDLAKWCAISFFDNGANPCCNGGHLFLNDEEIKDVADIPAGVTSIGKYAFYGYSSLKSVAIPESVTSICVCAFSGCSSLESIKVPLGVTAIGEGAFSSCSSLQSITLPEGLTSLAHTVFSNCSSLLVVTIPESVTSIEYGAFSGCSSLASIEILGQITAVGSKAFSGCSEIREIVGWQPNVDVTSAQKIIVSDSLTSISDHAFSAYGSLQSVVIPESVTVIGNSAFDGCNLLESIAIPNSLASIGNAAFRGCGSLKSIIIPESVLSIGAEVFEGCDGLKEIVGWRPGLQANVERIVISSSVVAIGESAFSGCDALVSLTIPDSVRAIGNGAFNGCTSLMHITIPGTLRDFGDNDLRETAACTGAEGLIVQDGWALGYSGTAPEVVTIPEGVVGIASHAFEGQTDIGTIHLPSTLKYIGVKAFRNCTWIQDLNLPEGLEKIDVAAFENCTSLDHLVCPEGLLEIGADAFKGCWRMLSVSLPASLDQIGNSAFSGCSSLVGATLPSHLRPVSEILPDVYRGLTEIIIAEGSTNVCANAFVGCAALTSIDIPESVVSIDAGAFGGCEYLNEVSLPTGLVRIGTASFKGCSRLLAVEFPDALKEIGAEAFRGCGRLSSVVFADGLETIGESAFYEAVGISSLKFPQTLRSIGANAFYGLRDLRSVEIPEGVTEVGAGAFANCANIQEVTMPVGAWTVGGVFTTAYKKIGRVQVVGEPTALPDGFLRNCSAIKEFEIPKTIQTIGVEAFKGTALLAINLPSGLKGIGDSAFYGLAAPSVLILPEGLEEIGGSAFYGCSSITEVEIPMGVERLEASTFASCAKLVKVVLPASLTSINGTAFSNDATIRSVSLLGDLGAVKTIFPNAYDEISEVTIDEDSSGLCEGFMDGCKSVLAVGVPAGVKTIGKNAFRNCAALESFALPTGVTTISAGIFSGCTRLSSIVFPSEVTSLGANIFKGCTALASVYFLGSAPNVDINVYSGTPTTLTTYVVKGSVEWDGIPNSKALPKAWPTTNGRTITYWEPNVFDVTFFGNGGTPESQVVSETTGTTYIMPQENPSRVGATFAGWWTEPVNGGQVKGTMRVDLTRPHSFYAHWRFNRYTVRFEANGADGEMPTLAMTVDEPMNLPSSGFVRIDHDFVGWALEPEGEVVFTDGAEVINLSVEDGETVRLYAVWAERVWSAADYLGAKGLVFTSDGDAVWFPDAGSSHDGIGSMRSGEIGIADEGESTRSTLRTTVAGNGTLTFWWKVNCEGPDPDYGDLYDYLEFTIDGVRPVAVEPIAGDVDWMEVEVRIEGTKPTHELAWSFVKDDWDEEALPDVAWVDELIWTSDTVTVSFDGNGATDGDIPSAMALVAGAELVLPEAGTLHKRTCKFGGWTNGSKTYAAGETYVIGAADVTFSAVWIEFTIADALNASELVFTTGGDAVWTADFETSHDGEASVRSGVVGTSQDSWIETKVDGAGTLTFIWKADGFVYRNNPANYVQYVVDGGEAVKVAVCDWTEVEIEVTGAGEHTVRWSYSHTRSQTSGGDCAWLDEVGWVATEVPLSPTVEGDEGATVTGDAETGFVVKPSEGKTTVEVTIPQGVDAAKITVEVSPKVASVKPNGAKVKIVSGGADITGFLNVPAADGSGVIDLTKATVKEEIVKEVMDVEKGAKIVLDAADPKLTTAPTRVGLFYLLREGETLGAMKDGDSTVGNGEPWSPKITVKGGNSAFYSIGVGKYE